MDRSNGFNNDTELGPNPLAQTGSIAQRLDWPLLSWIILLCILCGLAYLLFTNLLYGIIFAVYAIVAIIIIPKFWKPFAFAKRLIRSHNEHTSATHESFVQVSGILNTDNSEGLKTPMSAIECDYWSIKIEWYGDSSTIGLKSGKGRKTKWHPVGASRSHAYFISLNSGMSNYHISVFLAEFIGEKIEKQLSPIEFNTLKEHFPELNQYNLDGQIRVVESYIPKDGVVQVYGILNVLPSNQLPNWVKNHRFIDKPLDVFTSIYLLFYKYRIPVDLRILVNAKTAWSGIMHKLENKKYGQALDGSKNASIILPNFDIGWGAIKTPIISSLPLKELCVIYNKKAWLYMILLSLWTTIALLIIILSN